MTNKLLSLINNENRASIAVETGNAMHALLQKVFYPCNDGCDTEILEKISKTPELCEYMGKLSKTEVPIAGFVNGVFISRRIDRLYVNPQTKKVVVLDYKTDINRELYFKKYTEQLREYHDLLKQVYPDFNIQCKILWTHDFTLENVI